jgi:cyanate permease
VSWRHAARAADGSGHENPSGRAALGCWSGGLVHDWTHSYNPLIAFALVSVLLGMIPFLVVPALGR